MGFGAATLGTLLVSDTGVSPFATLSDDCAEAWVADSNKQNNAGKMVFMGQSTALPFLGEG